MQINEEEIIRFMRDEGLRPLSFKELVKILGVPKPDRDPLKWLLKDMVSAGTLVKIRGGRYGLPSKMNLVTGTLQCHGDGYGFVIPEVAPGEKKGEDVFIGKRRLKGAMHGDKVVSRVEGVKDRGKREGAIIRILERANTMVVGSFARSRGFSIVSPSNQRILNDIIIPPRMSGGAKEGQMVVAEITRWPAKNMAPAGKVVEVLGSPDNPDVECEIIVRKFDLAHQFPDTVLKEAACVPATVSELDTEGRVDLRKKHIVTIDGETAKDFDDAVTVERDGDGYRLFVSIADVSHYVKEGSEIDREAYARSTSVYFPDRCIPMLPERLSNGICSLNPKVDRLTLTAEITFDKKGVQVSKKLYESVIRSAERLTYTKVKAILAGEPELSETYSHISEQLHLMEELAKKLQRERSKDGSIDFDLPEPQIIIDIEGKVEDIVRSERNIAHRLIEEFMLAANKAVGEEFSKKELPFIYRIHPKPDHESTEEFREFVAGFGYDLRLSKSGLRPKDFQLILAAAEGKPEERLINHVLLRSMKQAVYSENNIGHFGLAFSDYTHFTSPIRRYPDLIVHRLVRKLFTNKYSEKEQKRAAAYLPGAATHTSTMERKAMEAERDIVDLKKAQFMKDKEGEEFEGLISGVTSFGLFVELKEFFIEGLVHVTTLADDYYIFMEKLHRLVGESTKKEFNIGDEVTVLVESVDIERRRIDMQLSGESAGVRRSVAGKSARPKKGAGPKRDAKPKRTGKPKKKDGKKKGKNKRGR
ncbi:MAG: ribonuclease R [Thermodesulfobacteriota bacterium]